MSEVERSAAKLRMVRIGRTGSTDRLILRLHRGGMYVSIRLYGMRGVWAAFGPTYVNRAGLRP